MSVAGLTKNNIQGSYHSAADSGPLVLPCDDGAISHVIDNAIDGTAATAWGWAEPQKDLVLQLHFDASEVDRFLALPTVPVDRIYEIKQVTAIWTVAATTATLDVLVVDDGDAITSGTTALASTIDLAGTANTRVLRDPVTGLAGSMGGVVRQMTRGQSIGVNFTWTTAGSFAGGLVEVTLAIVKPGMS